MFLEIFDLIDFINGWKEAAIWHLVVGIETSLNT